VKSNGTISLDHLEVGQSGRIAHLDLKPAEAQRLMEMGLTIGTEILLLRRAPLKYPVVIQARGSHMSLRKRIARSIRIQRSGSQNKSEKV
jgi:ferrous iron transport protein A